MINLSKAIAGVITFYVCGGVLVIIFAAVHYARKAYRHADRWLRFRAARKLHRIPDFGRPLDRKEKAAFARIRWHYGWPAATEPEHEHQENF